MYNVMDFNLTTFLEALAAEYAQDGYTLQTLPFVYGVDFFPLAVSGTARQTVTIDHDSDFALCQQNSASFVAATGVGVAFPEWTAQVRLSTSQRALQNQQTPGVNIFGTAQRPYQLYKPLVLPAKSSFEVTLVNGAVAAYNVSLSFIGVKLFAKKTAG